MKILYHPSYVAPEETGAPAESADEPNISLLTDTEILRVLQVRPPTLKWDLPLALEPDIAAAAPAPAPPMAPVIAKAPVAAKAPDLADALESLAGNAYQIEDLSRTTGVRHLRIEVQRKSRRPAKASGRPRKG